MSMYFNYNIRRIYVILKRLKRNFHEEQHTTFTVLSIIITNLIGMIEGSASLLALMPAIINNNQRDPSDKNAPVSYDLVTEIEACRASGRRRKRRRGERSLRDSSNEIRRSRSEAVSGHDSIPADSFNLLFIVLLFSVQER